MEKNNISLDELLIYPKDNYFFVRTILSFVLINILFSPGYSNRFFKLKQCYKLLYFKRKDYIYSIFNFNNHLYFNYINYIQYLNH